MKKIYAVKIANDKEVVRKEIGAARIYDDNTISARKYNELKRSLFNAFKKIHGGVTVVMVTEDGLRDSFGGFPATGYVKFN